MPQKSLPKTRTWGTRFDPLPSSPPQSPKIHDAVVVNNPLSTGVTEQSSEVSFKKKDDKMPHDASIFVGSLPSNVDQQELVHLLSDHLFEHTEVKNIKVVRDSKGGVCAFVQCENASSAARLIQNLHSSEPKPFLGRILRYEPARAFRTLLISYRTPMQFVPFGTPGLENVGMGVHNEGQFHELELPFAMRLWKPWKAKYTSILYNAEARNAENHAVTVSQNVANSNNGPTLYLDPLINDAETIRKLSLHFGTLEHFGPFMVSPSIALDGEEMNNVVDFGNSQQSYAAPHNAPRNASMDAGCWEVKWDHRDDCISALMTLRRVPHLTVTWAHQPMSSGIDNHSPIVPSQSQRFHPPNSVSYPYHEHEHEHPPGGGGPSSLGDAYFPYLHSSTSLPARLPELLSPTALNPSASNGWSREHVKEGSRILNPQFSPTSPPLSGIVDGKGQNPFSMNRLEWTETDFPPLGDFKGERRTETGVWADKKMMKVDSEHIRSPASSTTALMTPHVTTTPLANTEANSDNAAASYKGDEQELDIPPTPELGMSPITPKTPGSIFPNTPTGYVGNFQTSTSQEVEGKDNYYGDLIGGEKDLDPTTIFVGGLEMFGPAAWNEEKVHNFFAKFGVVESVKLVRPLNGRSAFAFIKFNNTDAPARAVNETHNSLHDGRQMRVQLRDCNPPRGAWRYGRGRGRCQQYVVQRQYAELMDKPDERKYVGGCTKAVPHDQLQEYDLTEQQDKNIGHVSIYTATATEFPTLNNKDGPISRSQFPDCFGPAIEKGSDERPSDARSHNRTTEPTTESHLSSPEPSARGISQHGGYREWYEEPASTNLTPPSSSFGSSASATAPTAPPPFIPYPMPNLGPYLPQGWMPPIPQHFPYPIPYMAGYPGFNVPLSQPHSFPSPAGSDAAGTAGMPTAWGPIGGMYTPYPPLPSYPTGTPSIDPSQAQQSSGQAPLVPTGFIQGEQGTLIPVYHPEALDHYMSTGRPGVATLPQPQVQSGPTWPFQPPPFNFQPSAPSGFPSQAFQGSQNQPRQGMNMGWIPGPPQLGLSHTASGPFVPTRHPAYSVFRGGHFDTRGRPSNIAPPKRNQRREQQNAYNGNRNNHTRLVPHRYPRGSGGNPEQLPRQPQTAPPQFVPFTGDLGQWAASR